MTKVEELRKKIETLDKNSQTIVLYKDAIYKLQTSVKLEFYLEGPNNINISGRLTRDGLKTVRDDIIKDFLSQIRSMVSENKKIRKELGDSEELED